MDKKTSPPIDPVALTAQLVRCPSITPQDHGALALIEKQLLPLGFRCEHMSFAHEGFARVDNLYARWGTGTPHFCFAGHTDVVPVGDETKWTHPPFAAIEEEGILWGRGSADMKSALAAFITAVSQFLAVHGNDFTGSISLMITGDEEGPAINGTRAMVATLKERGEKIDHCLVGEPSSVEKLGDMIKIGRRGSCNCHLRISGTQGHVAYPHRADNPAPKLVRALAGLLDPPLDQGYPEFQQTNLEISHIATPKLAENVIPPSAEAYFNVRFNPHWEGEKLIAHLHERLEKILGGREGWDLQARVAGEAFLTTDKKFIQIIADAVKQETGTMPDHSTSGGTSDARFIRFLCPVAEMGLIGASIHKIDEHVDTQDIHRLSSIYHTILKKYFSI